ncbi:DUF1127 domain-containing protein [Sulfitobacter sp. BDSS02]|nr:DUF1127 domain-containing protein [Sulfitobacter sp. BDSS02]MBR9852264.1 DUF1127 domain-containing protein [Paracoccaceae bacterium]
MAHALTANTITFPIIARLRGTIENFRADRALRREYDATCAQLMAMSDRDLNDINIRRGDIADIVRKHVYGA